MLSVFLALLPLMMCGVQILSADNLIPPVGTSSGDQHGFSVAVSGDWLSIGSPFDTIASEFSAGSVAMYRRTSVESWDFSQHLTAPDFHRRDRFGYALAMTPGWVIIGAPMSHNLNASVYSFRLSSSTWNYRNNYVYTGESGSFFSFSLSASGEYFVAGAPFEYLGSGLVSSGAAYIFEYDNATQDWSLDSRLISSAPEVADLFGSSLAMQGRWLAVGAFLADGNPPNGTNAGSVTMFELIGGNWTFVQRIVEAQGEYNSFFGKSVSISDYGYMVVGASNAQGGRGSASIYSFNSGSSNWDYLQLLNQTEFVGSEDLFGISVAAFKDWIAVCSPGKVDNTGLILTYSLVNGTFEYAQTLYATDAGAKDMFGYSIAIEDGTIAVGAPLHNNGTGAAYVYLANCDSTNVTGNCKSCGAGLFQPPLSVTCSPCYGTVITDLLCVPCPAPQYAVTPGNCTTCRGVYVNESTCYACPPTFYSPLGGSCEPCPSGYAPNADDSACVECSYRKVVSSSSGRCEECPRGHVPNYGRDRDHCEKCDADEYVLDNKSDKLECTKCETGMVPSKDRKSCVSDKEGTALIAGLSIGLGLLCICVCCALLCILCIAICCVLLLLIFAVIVVLFVVVVLVALAAAGVIVGLNARKNSRYRPSFDLSVFEGYEGEEVNDGLQRDFRELAFADLTFDKKIGEGAFSRVFLGKWRQATSVAIKELNVAADPAAKASFVHEANVMAHLGNHPNVVRFIGAVTTEDRFYMVTEFAPNGSLNDLIHSNRVELTRDLVLRLCRDAAAGLAHLHAEGIVHRDVAARNFLVSQDLTVMVTDFGLSRILQEETEGPDRRAIPKNKRGSSSSDSDASTQAGNAGEQKKAARSAHKNRLTAQRTKSNIGPVRWMAPESLSVGEYSFASDVFMFGRFLYEMEFMAVPFDGMSPQEVIVAVTERNEWPKEVERNAKRGESALCRVMRVCWADKEMRPSMAEVHAVIDALCGEEELEVESDDNLAMGELASNYFNVKKELEGEEDDEEEDD